ncbi:hypothetical protein [Cronobacter phage vB_Cdu_VP8]|nr:hypothetical protein [Cronobacter phage vB_Cdu_VP8]
MTICAVCKQPIDEALVIESALGPVHPGLCANYAADIPVSESAEQELSEVQLIV